MNNRLQPIFILHQITARPALIIFWSIVLTIQVLLLVTLAFFSDADSQSSMMLGGSGAIYVFMTITGVLTFKETFPLALSMGSTRKHYFTGTQVFYFGLALFQTLIMTVLAAIESLLQSSIEHVNLYHYRLYGSDSAVEAFVFNLVLIWFLITFANMLASWAYKIGRVFWFGVGAVVIILFSLSVLFGWIIPIIQWLSSLDSFWIGALYLLPITLIAMVLSWLPVRRAEIRKI